MGSVSGSMGGGHGSGGGMGGGMGVGCMSAVVGEGLANLRRNLRFRSVARPEPDNLIQYWSNCFTSVTVPILSHRRGAGPV